MKKAVRFFALLLTLCVVFAVTLAADGTEIPLAGDLITDDTELPLVGDLLTDGDVIVSVGGTADGDEVITDNPTNDWTPDGAADGELIDVFPGELYGYAEDITANPTNDWAPESSGITVGTLILVGVGTLVLGLAAGVAVTVLVVKKRK